MNTKSIDSEKDKTLWFIDLDWYKLNNRSISVLAIDCLCPKCRKRLKIDKGEVEITELMATISDCCYKMPGFISKELPILESIFRLFLANKNQPLEIGVIKQKLGELRGGDAYQTSVELLYRLLLVDRHYGLKKVNN